jgi:hypothetical protein
VAVGPRKSKSKPATGKMNAKVNGNTNIFQLNRHKSNITISTLIDTKFKDNVNIALIQEPPNVKVL